jgi:hypothetical protein
MRRSVSLLAALALSTSACAMSTGAKGGTIVGGVALGIIGYQMIESSAVDADHDGTNETWLDDDLGKIMAGQLAMLAGVGLLIAGLTSHEPEVTTPSVTLAAAAPVTGAAPYSETAPARLPELPASPEVLRLAQQVRSLGAAEQCHAAWATWRQLDALDHAYAKATLANDIMSSCTGFEPEHLVVTRP